MHADTDLLPDSIDDAPPADERHVVRDPREIRALLQALVQQRNILGAYVDGRGQSFPSAVLEVTGDGLVLDGSPVEAVNRSIGSADSLLCFAQVDRVLVRFRVYRPRQREHEGYVAFQAPLPVELYYPQRRDLYRLETDPTDSPWCRFPATGDREALRLRAVDISAGGLAVLLPDGQETFQSQQRLSGCELELPEGAPLDVTLAVCSLTTRTGADGVPRQRVGFRFEDLPRGADAAIQRHIFRIARERRARADGNG